MRAAHWIAGLGGLAVVLLASAARAAGGKAPAKGPSGAPGSAPPIEDGSRWPDGLAAREAGMLAAVQAGLAEHAWTPIQLAHGGHVGTIDVSEDDIRIAGVRVSVTARTLAAMARELGGVLATSRVADLVYAQAVRTTAPLTHKWYLDDSMGTTRRMLEYSAEVDAKIGTGGGLAANTGKWWVQSVRLKNAKPGTAANYGWHTGRGNEVIQGVGIRHDDQHADYSQKARIMRDTMTVDGVEMPTSEVLASSELAGLLSSEGVI